MNGRSKCSDRFIKLKGKIWKQIYCSTPQKFCDSREDIIPTPSNPALKNGKLRQKHLSLRHTAFECLHRATLYFRASINSLIRLFNFAVIIACKIRFVNSILKFFRINLFFTDIFAIFVQYHKAYLTHNHKNVNILRCFYTL